MTKHVLNRNHEFSLWPGATPDNWILAGTNPTRISKLDPLESLTRRVFPQEGFNETKYIYGPVNSARYVLAAAGTFTIGTEFNLDQVEPAVIPGERRWRTVSLAYRYTAPIPESLVLHLDIVTAVPAVVRAVDPRLAATEIQRPGNPFHYTWEAASTGIFLLRNGAAEPQEAQEEWYKFGATVELPLIADAAANLFFRARLIGTAQAGAAALVDIGDFKVEGQMGLEQYGG